MSESSDAGTTIPLILLCFLIAMFAVCGGIVASTAFLAQRDLSALCDGAALAAAQSLDDALYFAEGSVGEGRPLGSVQHWADEYLVMSGREDVVTTLAAVGPVVTVHCATIVRVPFGHMFGLSGGVERKATSQARATDLTTANAVTPPSAPD